MSSATAKNYKKRAILYEDHKYPENSTQNGKKLKLPQLLSYKLPADLMSELNIPQLTLEELKSKLKKKDNNEDSSNDNDIIVKVKVSETMTIIKKISDRADALKTTAIKEFGLKHYEISLVSFSYSFLLTVLALRWNEIERNDEINYKLNNKLNNKEINSLIFIITRKETDWKKVLDYGCKIIDNFKKILNIAKINDSRLFNVLSHLLGLIFYGNGLIELYLSELDLQHINLLKIKIGNHKNENENLIDYKKITDLIEIFEKYSQKSKESFIDGEKRLGLFIIKKAYDELFNQSLERLSQLNKDELVLSRNLLFLSGKENKFKTGVNYCLPICSHTWKLDNLINFGGFFIKIWCERQSIKENMIFQ